MLPLVTISCCWDTRRHPGPTGLQLNSVADTLEANLDTDAGSENKGIQGDGRVLDMLSLYQGDLAKAEAAKNTAMAEGKSKEKVEEARLRSRAPQGRGLVVCAHKGTSVFLLTPHLRDGCSLRGKGYEDSDWTTHERCSAEQIKGVDRYEAGWAAIADFGGERRSVAGRRWPVGPDGFDTTAASCSLRPAPTPKPSRRSSATSAAPPPGRRRLDVDKPDCKGVPSLIGEDEGGLTECLRRLAPNSAR
ncbi:unnamed protein product [Prorocentrum cordatum]|uniref:Uncharacterized protein n=1 Tax=Prorocentrum cordatum TaxID=2364126 RepID=A0ABN9TWE1_9DINO|nr:unnamed protein product [Polarella glacialis]